MDCDGYFVAKEGKYGPFLGCSTYPECDVTKDLPFGSDWNAGSLDLDDPAEENGASLAFPSEPYPEEADPNGISGELSAPADVRGWERGRAEQPEFPDLTQRSGIQIERLDRVEHSIFGKGVVLDVTGSGWDEHAEIHFDGVGIKEVMTRHPALSLEVPKGPLENESAGLGTGTAPETFSGSHRTSRSVPDPGRVLAAVGMAVRHPDYGDGVIEQVIGEGEGKEVQIRFARVGVKTVLVRSARIELTGDDIPF